MTRPEGEAAHRRALESLYAAAPINQLFDSTLEIESGGVARIRFTLDERHFHAAGAVHGTSYFKMLDDAAFYAANSLVTDRFLLTTAFNLLFTRPLNSGEVTAEGRWVSGRRRVMVLGSGALAVALALHGLADTFPALLAMRVLAGAGGGMLSGAAVSYVGDAFPYEARGRATGWVMSGVPFGLVFGIPVGRMLAVGYGFQMPFVAFSAVMALAFVLLLTVVPQPDVERTERPTVVGALRQYADFLRRPGPATAALLYFVMYGGLGLLIVYLPGWLTERFSLDVSWRGRPLRVFGLPVDFIATLFFAGGVASVLVGPQAGALSDRLGRKPLILASSVGLALVAALLPVLVAYALYVALMSLFAMRMAPFQALLTALVPASERGAFLALTIAVGQIGTGAGAIAGGVLYERLGFGANAGASAATMLLMAVLVWRLLPEPADPDAAPAVPAAPGPVASAGRTPIPDVSPRA